ncbi:uncharacterized protein LOC133887024 isoform X2 [Phragmites australis]|uniref:uncharacterized protein LOC133887024 isoform X2 n=1 Tax=Phragmites australis TaxID=29695 RepID=UPI002D785165|nr:uncharacterized protein LOC133887024 isoform X2 [Phragmites australis]
MASPVALLRCPISDCLDPPSAFPRGPEHCDPVVSDDADDYLPPEITYDDLGADSDEDDDLCDLETTCPGQSFTKEEEEKIRRKWIKGYINLCGQRSELYNEFLSNEDENSPLPPLPPRPLKVLPETTYSCIERGYCYHREYMTNDTSETARTLGFCEPNDMLQVLSLRLLRSESCPISVYGTFAIRDDLEPLRNYVLNRTRDDPIMIQQDSFALPLCSPCRGMYVLDRALLDVDLWVKKEGDRSSDEQLLSVYVEINLRSSLDEKLTGRIHSDHCMLDMDCMFLAQSVEATIQVAALVDNPHHLRFIAFSSCFDDEIILFKGKGVKKGELIQHVVAVKAEEKLGVRLELENSLFEWTFQDWTFQDETVGVSSSPDESTMNQFHVRVFLAPKNLPPITSRYLDWKRRCRNKWKMPRPGLLK